MNLRYAAFILLSLCAAPAYAEDPEHKRCMEASGGVTVEMLDCISVAHERADAALNTLWTQEFPNIRPELATPVQEAQRQWIRYRDTTCAAEAAVWGEGSFASVALADCQLRLTEERVGWLRSVFSPAGER